MTTTICIFFFAMNNNELIFLNLFCESDELLKEIEALCGKSFVFKVNVALDHLENLAKAITIVRVITDEAIEFAHCGDLLDSQETDLDSKFENDKDQSAEDVASGDEAESPITVMGSTPAHYLILWNQKVLFARGSAWTSFRPPTL